MDNSVINMYGLYKKIIEEYDGAATIFCSDDELFKPYIWLSNEEGTNEAVVIYGKTEEECEKSLDIAIAARKTNDYKYSSFDSAVFPFLLTKRIKDLYKRALYICDVLDIPCPPIYICDLGCADYGATESIIDGVCIVPIKVQINSGGLAQQTITLAHELRHCWQNYHGRISKFALSHPDSSDYGDSYLFDPEEIDAVAFSFLFSNEVLHRDARIIELNNGFSFLRREDYTSAIEKQIRVIEAEGYNFCENNLLGTQQRGQSANGALSFLFLWDNDFTFGQNNLYYLEVVQGGVCNESEEYNN